MEERGERFAREWERKAERIERDAERQVRLAEREAAIAERYVERASQMAERQAKMQERNRAMQEKRETLYARGYEGGSNSKVKKVIKIKIPKKAKLKTNIRHGELKLSSVIHNMSGDISHSFLLADNIDGGDTSINVSYSPVVINNWSLGSLTLNYVDKAQIKNAGDIVLNAKSSNINIEKLINTGIIDGSFGELTISNLDESFRNLNLVLENSDAYVNLPDNANYSLFFKGSRSKYNNAPTNQKTIRNYPEGSSTDKTIVVNAKYSNVIVD